MLRRQFLKTLTAGAAAALVGLNTVLLADRDIGAELAAKARRLQDEMRATEEEHMKRVITECWDATPIPSNQMRALLDNMYSINTPRLVEIGPNNYRIMQSVMRGEPKGWKVTKS